RPCIGHITTRTIQQRLAGVERQEFVQHSPLFVRVVDEILEAQQVVARRAEVGEVHPHARFQRRAQRTVPPLKARVSTCMSASLIEAITSIPRRSTCTKRASGMHFAISSRNNRWFGVFSTHCVRARRLAASSSSAAYRRTQASHLRGI